MYSARYALRAGRFYLAMCRLSFWLPFDTIKMFKVDRDRTFALLYDKLRTAYGTE
jgi:hypothetical protein